MLAHIEWPFDYLIIQLPSQFIVAFIIFSIADYSFGILDLISTVCDVKNSLKNWRIAADYETNIYAYIPYNIKKLCCYGFIINRGLWFHIICEIFFSNLIHWIANPNFKEWKFKQIRIW